MHLEEYITLIQKKFFYLFEDFDFHIVVKEENRPGYLRIGLRSKKCKILFVREQGSGVMFFGSAPAPFEDENNRQWVVMASLLAYITKQEIDWTPLENIPHQIRIEAGLSLMAKELKPFCERLIGMFQSSDVLAQWRPAYEQYMAKKIHNLVSREIE